MAQGTTLVPSSEYKLHYLHILFGQKLFSKIQNELQNKICSLCIFKNIFDVHFMLIIFQYFKIIWLPFFKFKFKMAAIFFYLQPKLFNLSPGK